MGIDDAFDEFQKIVNEDIDKTRLARRRRDLFKAALLSEPDVVETFGSGSLSRSTQLKPIHDVDIVVVYDPAEHPDWGFSGSSSEEALEHIRTQVNRLLSRANGTHDKVPHHHHRTGHGRPHHRDRRHPARAPQPGHRHRLPRRHPRARRRAHPDLLPPRSGTRPGARRSGFRSGWQRLGRRMAHTSHQPTDPKYPRRCHIPAAPGGSGTRLPQCDRSDPHPS